ncbi:hypothetical protein [Ktedonobacter robiniae]|uniref:hypothetical protein n=1 Tax=Ktedonobacter robiniae TaxID=2778365 RepID=UPI001916045D|nr:hypothetical protein [Ktedonobacter robiniae]
MCVFYGRGALSSGAGTCWMFIHRVFRCLTFLACWLGWLAHVRGSLLCDEQEHAGASGA